jgi:hypothetical protein
MGIINLRSKVCCRCRWNTQREVSSSSGGSIRQLRCLALVSVSDPLSPLSHELSIHERKKRLEEKISTRAGIRSILVSCFCLSVSHSSIHPSLLSPTFGKQGIIDKKRTSMRKAVMQYKASVNVKRDLVAEWRISPVTRERHGQKVLTQSCDSLCRMLFSSA